MEASIAAGLSAESKSYLKFLGIKENAEAQLAMYEELKAVIAAVDNKSAGTIYETFKLISKAHDKALDLNMDGVASVETVKALYREYDKLVQAARRARNEASDEDSEEESDSDEEEEDEEEVKEKEKKGINEHCNLDSISQNFLVSEIPRITCVECGLERKRQWITNFSGKTLKSKNLSRMLMVKQQSFR